MVVDQSEPGTKTKGNAKPWTIQEEMIVCERHQMFGNKWAEIAKNLPLRDDSMVKNFFYSSIRKNMRKIVKGRISLDQQTNPDARRVSLYFIEYVKLNNQAYEDHK